MKSFLDRKRAKKGIASLALVTFLPAVLHTAFLPTSVLAAEARELLEAARNDVEFADYEVGLEKVKEALELGVAEDQRVEAYVLMARCEAGLGHRAAAVEAFYLVIRTDPTWRPDPVFYRQDEIEMFEEALSIYERTEQTSYLPPGETVEPSAVPWYKKPKILGGLGALVAAGIILAVSGGGDGDGDGGNELPYFPNHP
jgi:hypothetical protein